MRQGGPLDDPTPPDELDALVDPRRLAGRLVAGVAGLVVVVIAATALLGEPIARASEGFATAWGMPGVLVGALLCDLVALPKEPVLLLGYQGGLGLVAVTATGCAASLLAATVNWGLGRRFGRLEVVRRWLGRTPVGPFLHRFGGRAVGIAAVVPFPFAAMCWAAGAVGLPYRRFLLGALFRVPKTIVVFLLVVGGASLGTSLGG